MDKQRTNLFFQEKLNRMKLILIKDKFLGIVWKRRLWRRKLDVWNQKLYNSNFVLEIVKIIKIQLQHCFWALNCQHYQNTTSTLFQSFNVVKIIKIQLQHCSWALDCQNYQNTTSTFFLSLCENYQNTLHWSIRMFILLCCF